MLERSEARRTGQPRLLQEARQLVDELMNWNNEHQRPARCAANWLILNPERQASPGTKRLVDWS